jgi:ABC-type nickel/cobalt efflux system permease component RcnA
MTDFAALLQQGNAWLFVPSAIALGALHGLEPGHSKTMMAAFIVAVRGTVAQAVLLGLAATLSHTAVVWAVAVAGLSFGRNFDAETSEPYFQLVSGVLILLVAGWMLWRTLRARPGHHHHGHDHDHHHGQGHRHAHDDDADDHERAHAEEIQRRFANRHVTTGQIVAFGLTGGLIPCPASITVLLLCLQLKQFTLGAALVLCFSVGLALTLVASGTLAALSVRHVERRWSGFGAFARNAPVASSVLIGAVGLYVCYGALRGLQLA